MNDETAVIITRLERLYKDIIIIICKHFSIT
jgi:hypothetical protein